MTVLRSILLLLAFLPALSPAQSSSDTNNVIPGRVAIATGVVAGTATAIHIYQRNAWWQGPAKEFWFVPDWAYSQGIDKLGHMFGGYLAAHTFNYIMQWTGFREQTSVFWGSVLGLGFELYVEIEDGYHQNYGFSTGDAFADLTGAMLPLVAYEFPVVDNFRLKWSYWPSDAYLDALHQGKSKAFVDDYSGERFWLAIDPHFVMGEDLRRFIPAWLGIALGFGVRNANERLGNGESVFYIAFDYDLRKIGTDSPFLKGLFTALDFIHLPAPGLEVFKNDVKFVVVF